MLLVLIQLLISLAAWVWSLINLANKTDLSRRRVFQLASLHAASGIALFFLFGWVIFTSAHRQGPENLVFFLFAALLPMWLGIYRKRMLALRVHKRTFSRAHR
jgi:hypothetical protein